ncbi:MAG: hypothetical protein RIQ72_311 [Candidatus Parcubacteria bacterium]|jgi:ATP-dependent exoDNAse (exonuclease V) alpha subunit
MTQETALDILKLGHNVYLTGAAGSGKTYVLNQYIKYLRDAGIEVAITASTGIAATHMGGVTIHAWSGIGIRKVLHEADIASLMEKQHLVKRFQKTKVLIIDEVSMLHHTQLDMVDRILRAFRNSDTPFGGIQIVLCGDFFQLPPVSKMGEPRAKFIYHSQVWRVAKCKICYLEEQHRQKDDDVLQVLNDIRNNDVGVRTIDILKQRFISPTIMQSVSVADSFEGVDEVYTEYTEETVEVIADEVDDLYEFGDTKSSSAQLPQIQSTATRLFTHNIDVDEINDQYLDQLEAEEYEYLMEEVGKDHLVETLKKSCLAPELLRLKVGAKVMFVKNNFEEGYVNGTTGIVTKLTEDGPTITISQHDNQKKEIMPPLETWSIEEDGKVKASISQFPLRLAWAITIHKSQGMSLDSVEVDLSKSFEKGMGYVALSRARTLEGLTILGLNDMSLRVNDEIIVVDEKLRSASIRAEQELQDEYSDRESIQLAQKEIQRRWMPTEQEKQKKLSTIEQTKLLVEKKMSLKKMAQERGITEETIIDHIEQLIALDPFFQEEMTYLKSTLPFAKQKLIKEAFKKVFLDAHPDEDESEFTMTTMRSSPLAPIKHILGNKASYRDIRLARVILQ